MGGVSLDESSPLLMQLLHLEPAQYQAWVNRPSRGKARFFASDRLESVTKVKWWMVPLLWMPLALMLAWQALACGQLALHQAAGLVAAGVLLWQLIEYSLHRWVFHLVPTRPWAILLHFLLHGNHHKFPSDVERLVFPPLPACIPAACIYGALRACLPQVLATAVFSGVLLGYLAYDMLHYFMHSGRVRGTLRRRHMHHHYGDGQTGFGISSPLFDAVFGTLPSKFL